VLAVHLSTSVGWLGALVAYLVLDLAVVTSDDAALVRASLIAMGRIVSYVIVPLAFASLLTGVVIAAGTRWGLFRHWWVVVSLVLTVAAVVVLVLEMGVVERMAVLAADPATTDAALAAVPGTLPHSIGGVVLLLVVHWLNVFKPRGLTRYGWRREREERAAAQRPSVEAK
jgi:hypothetical protein